MMCLKCGGSGGGSFVYSSKSGVDWPYWSFPSAWEPGNDENEEKKTRKEKERQTEGERDGHIDKQADKQAGRERERGGEEIQIIIKAQSWRRSMNNSNIAAVWGGVDTTSSRGQNGAECRGLLRRT